MPAAHREELADRPEKDKCSPPYVPAAAKKPRFLLNLAPADLFIAAIAIIRAAPLNNPIR